MPSTNKTRRMIEEAISSGEYLGYHKAVALKQPTIPVDPVTLVPTLGNTLVATYVPGPVSKTTLTLTAMPATIRNTEQGVGVKLLDLPEGVIRIRARIDALTYTVTSVLADTLNLSKVVNVSLGTATQTTATMAGTAESNVVPVTATTSPATISTATTAFSAQRDTWMTIDGSTTAPDLYLNFSVPTANDIDGDATITVNATITVTTEYLSDIALANASRMPTASLWANCPWEDIVAGRVDGHAYFNDFTNNYLLANNQTATNLGDGVMGFTAATAGTTINQVDASAPYGKLKIETTTINEDAGISIGNSNNVVAQYVFEAGKRLWMEVRVSVVNVTVTKLALLVAFAEEALLATTATLAAGGATIADKDYIGFHKRAADTVAADIVHNTAGGGGETILVADAVTFAADTFTKLGIYCDGTTIYFYQNGTALGSVALSATNVPDGEEVGLYIVLGAAHGDTCSAAVDWIKIAQARSN